MGSWEHHSLLCRILGCNVSERQNPNLEIFGSNRAIPLLPAGVERKLYAALTFFDVIFRVIFLKILPCRYVFATSIS
jgi:hypothetical protein